MRKSPSVQSPLTLALVSHAFLAACSPAVDAERKNLNCSIEAVSLSAEPAEVGHATVTVLAYPETVVPGINTLSTGEWYAVTARLFQNCEEVDCAEEVSEFLLGNDPSGPYSTCQNEVFFPTASDEDGNRKAYSQAWSVTGDTGAESALTFLAISREFELSDGSILPVPMGDNTDWPHFNGEIMIDMLDSVPVIADLNTGGGVELWSFWGVRNNVVYQL